MDASPLPWTVVMARSERITAGGLRSLMLLRRVARVRYDGLHDLLMIQPATDPLSGDPGPAHTRALVTLIVSRSWTGAIVRTTAAAVCMTAAGQIERSTVGLVDVCITRSPSGLVLSMRPTAEVPERTAAVLRITLILDPEQAAERAA